MSSICYVFYVRTFKGNLISLQIDVCKFLQVKTLVLIVNSAATTLMLNVQLCSSAQMSDVTMMMMIPKFVLIYSGVTRHLSTYTKHPIIVTSLADFLGNDLTSF